MNIGPIDGDNNTVGHHNTVNSNNVVVVNHRPGISLVGAFLLFLIAAAIVGFVIKHLALVLLIGAACMVVWAVACDLQERAQRKTELAERADAENAAYQAGDYRGIFGQYPPDTRAQ